MLKNFTIFSIIVLFVLSLIGCSSQTQNYESRISSIENTLAVQNYQISQLNSTLSAHLAETTEPTPTIENTPVPPTATPTQISLQDRLAPYSSYNQNDLLVYLPENFIHLFPDATINYVKLIYGDGYTIEIWYDGVSLTKSDFDTFANQVQPTPGEHDQRDWGGENGFISTADYSYNMYNYYDGGVILQIFFTSKPVSLDETKYFNDDLIDTSVINLPENLQNTSPEIWITLHDTGIDCVDTTLTWKDLTLSEIQTIMEHYQQTLMNNEYFSTNGEVENGLSIYARLDDYRIIDIKEYIEDSGYRLFITINTCFSKDH